MSVTDQPISLEELGQALLAAHKALPPAERKSDKAIRLFQQFLPIDTLREIDADEAKTERLLAVGKQPEAFAPLYGWLLFTVAEEAGLKGFLYQKAGKEAASAFVGVAVAFFLGGEDLPGMEWVFKESIGIAQAVGAVAHEAEGLLALGLWLHAHQQDDEAISVFHDGLLLVPRAEVLLRVDCPASRLGLFRKQTDKAARTLLTLLISRAG